MKTLADVAASSIEDVERRKPVEVAPETPVHQVLLELREHRRGSALVVGDAGLVGVFTERDVMKRIDFSSPSWQEIPVRELMTQNPKTIRTDQTVEVAINLMVAGGYRHLPTIDPDGALVGVISIRDLMMHVVGFFPDDFINLPPDPEREAQGPWGG